MKDATSLALITGASRGIGYQTAVELASQNITVIATARSTDRLDELASHSPRITPVPADLTKNEDRQLLVDAISEQGGQLHYLIHNAGALINKPFTELTDQDWQQMWQVNLMAAVQLTRSVLTTLSDGAHIVNISSMGGYQGSAKFPGLTAYSVAKGGLSILTECLAAELTDRNINSNCLCLGAVQTEMLQEAFPGMEAPVTATEMGTYVANFAINGSKFYNGKILPVALHDPS
ncbi:MAG: SDR family NAD(P)-dependent oxidoreductase [Bacteroidota bacterium]